MSASCSPVAVAVGSSRHLHTWVQESLGVEWTDVLVPVTIMMPFPTLFNQQTRQVIIQLHRGLEILVTDLEHKIKVRYSTCDFGCILKKRYFSEVPLLDGDYVWLTQSCSNHVAFSCSFAFTFKQISLKGLMNLFDRMQRYWLADRALAANKRRAHSNNPIKEAERIKGRLTHRDTGKPSLSTSTRQCCKICWQWQQNKNFCKWTMISWATALPFSPTKI